MCFRELFSKHSVSQVCAVPRNCAECSKLSHFQSLQDLLSGCSCALELKKALFHPDLLKT